MFEALAVESEPAEALALLDALARAPAAAALIVAALGQNGRKALRLAHTQLRDAVGEATTKLKAEFRSPPELAIVDPRPPTGRRWPRLEELTLALESNLNEPSSGAAVFEALGSEAWPRLHTFRVEERYPWATMARPVALALAAALRRMPALRALELWGPAEAAVAAMSRAATPQLRSLAVFHAPGRHGEADRAADRVAARVADAVFAMAASGLRLEALELMLYRSIGAAGIAALVAAPAFSIRRLVLSDCKLDAAAVLSLARAPWPLEELVLDTNDLSAAAAGPALAALSQHRGLRRLNVSWCKLSPAGFKALVEAVWPALTCLRAYYNQVALDGPNALGAAAFAAVPALEELELCGVALGEAGARLLASRRWARLNKLDMSNAGLGDPGLAALARGAWPALRELVLNDNGFAVRLTIESARRWAPALQHLWR